MASLDLTGPRLKIERAKKHISDLDTEIRQFLETKPYKFSAYRDSDRRPIYYLSDVRETPVQLSLITGDALQNLRASLDYMAHLLFMAANPGGNPKHIYFPITEGPAKYKSQGLGKIEGLFGRTLKMRSLLSSHTAEGRGRFSGVCTI